MSLAYDIATVVVTCTLAGNEFAVAAFVHPAISRLDDATHARAAAPLAAILGKVMPFWYVLSLLLAFGAALQRRPLLQGPGLLCLLAEMLYAAIVIFTLFLLVPINNRIAKLNPDHPYDGWLKDRARWDRLHRIRVIFLLVAAILIVQAVVVSAH